MYTDQDIANLVARVQQLEQQVAVTPHIALPQLGIISKNFLTRAFSVWGLYFVSSLIIGVAVSCVLTILGLILGVGFMDTISNLLQNAGL